MQYMTMQLSLLVGCLFFAVNGDQSSYSKIVFPEQDAIMLNCSDDLPLSLCPSEDRDVQICCSLLNQNQTTEYIGEYVQQQVNPVLPERCGITSYLDRILLHAGDPVPMEAYPWIVLLGYKGLFSELLTFKCSGSLISDRHVLTSAKCALMIKRRIGRPIARFGEWNIRTSPDCTSRINTHLLCSPPHFDVEVAQVFFHPKKRQNDIAIIKLQSAIDLTHDHVTINPICLPPEDLDLHELLTNRTAVLAGWGIAGSNKDIENNFDILHHTFVHLLHNKSCHNESNYSSHKHNEICVSQFKSANRSIGDLGSGLAATGYLGPPYFLIGVASRGAIDNPTSSNPGIFTSVGSYTGWIQRIVRESQK